MFGLGFTEILFISVIGLLVIGPEKLPYFIKEITNWIYKIRRNWNQLKYEVQDEIEKITDNKDLDNIKKGIGSFRNIGNNYEKPLEKLLGKKNKTNLLKAAQEVKDLTLSTENKTVRKRIRNKKNTIKNLSQKVSKLSTK